jgi:cytochrome c
MRQIASVAVALLISTGVSTGALFAQDLSAGEAVFHKCMPCHNIGPEARNKTGPELNGLDGRKAGTVDDFSYSEANRSSGIIWGEVIFKEYVRDPRGRVPGTKMIFAGIKSKKDVDDLWVYVSQFDQYGYPKQKIEATQRSLTK